MSEARPWIDRIGRRLARWRVGGLGGTWVVAVSGGGRQRRAAPSAAPARAEAGLRLSVAHLDHGVRGEAARADAAFVAELAASLGLAVRPGRIGEPARAGHFEADARRARYDWLAEIARRAGGGRGRRPHPRRPGRDDPAPHPPRHRPARTGRHPSPAVAVADPQIDAGPPAAGRLARERSGTISRRWASPFARTPPTPTSRGPAPGSATTSCPGSRPNTTRKVADALVRLG